jgi:hypothetical protein
MYLPSRLRSEYIKLDRPSHLLCLKTLAAASSISSVTADENDGNRSGETHRNHVTTADESQLDGNETAVGCMVKSSSSGDYVEVSRRQ